MTIEWLAHTVQLRGKLTLASESLASAMARISVKCSRVLHPSLACYSRVLDSLLACYSRVLDRSLACVTRECSTARPLASVLLASAGSSRATAQRAPR